MEPLGIALIGSGFIAHYHARAVREQTGAQLRVLCGVDIETVREFAARYAITDVTDDIGDVAARADIQAVIICTPNKFHAPYAIACMTHGKDVLVEKPMAIDAGQGRDMIRCADQCRRILMVGHMWRFDTEVNLIRDLVQRGGLGRIVKTKGYGIHVDWGPTGWFVQKDLAGGGALPDMGVHAIDAARYLLGDPRPREVYAKIGTSFGNYEVDDTGTVVITWETGAVSIIESGWWHPHADGPEASTQIFGTGGYASLFPTRIRQKLDGQLQETVPDVPPRRDHCDQSIYTRQMQHFLDCVRSRSQPATGADVGLVNLQIIDAAYESARTGQAVRL
jgi:predicted dehydrogenase